MELHNIVKRTLVTFWIFFLFQTTFFLILEDLFPLTQFSVPIFYYDFYIFNLFFSGLLIIFIIFFIKKVKNNFFFIYFDKINFNKLLRPFLYLTIIGIIFTLYSKYLLFGEKLLSEIFNHEYSISCIQVKIRRYWLANDSLISSDENKLLLYNFFSPIGTILINFYHILIFSLFFFKIKLRKKFFFIFTIIIAILAYLFATGSKNIILNTFTFTFSCFLICFIIKRLDYDKCLTFLFFILLTFSLVFFIQKLRTDCANTYGDYNFNSEFINTSPFSNKKNIEERGRFVLYEKEYSSTILNLLNIKSYNYNVTFNYTLFYLLTGKINGEYILHNIKRPLYGNIFISKTVNLFSKDFNKQIVPVNVHWAKSGGGISVLHILWHDYNYLGIILFIGIFIFSLFLCARYKSESSINNLLKSMIFIYLLMLFFYNFIQFFNWYALETINSRFIFFNLLIFFLYLYYKIKKSYKQNNFITKK